jgi:hypothetical protein
MKIYIGATEAQVRAALQRGKDRGIISQTVFFDRLRRFKPQASGPTARAIRTGFDVILQAWPDGLHGRRSNTGYAGGSRDSLAATYDEWGHFIAALYELDPDAQIGQYADRQHFNEITGDSYDPKTFTEDFAACDGHDPYPFVLGSVSNGRSGRVGAGRDDGDSRYMQRDYDAAVEWFEAGNLTKRQGSYVRYAPRTPEQVAAFCGVSVEAVHA